MGERLGLSSEEIFQSKLKKRPETNEPKVLEDWRVENLRLLLKELSNLEKREVEVTEGAGAKMREWGMSEGQIKKITEAVGAFRYDRAEEKTKELAREHIFERVGESISTPDLVTFANPRDGDCGNLAENFQLLCLKTDFLEEINQSLPPETELLPIDVWGNSKQFYAEGKGIHFWSGLTRHHSWMKEERQQDQVFIDLAFGRICVPRDGFYTYDLEDWKICVEVKTEAWLRQVWLPCLGDLDMKRAEAGITLGFAKDKQEILDLHFARDGKNQVVPVVSAIQVDSKVRTYYLGKGERLYWVEGSRFLEPKEPQLGEIKRVLEQAREIEFVTKKNLVSQIRQIFYDPDIDSYR